MADDDCGQLEQLLTAQGIDSSACGVCGAPSAGIFESVSYWKDAAGHVREGLAIMPLCATHARDCVPRHSVQAMKLALRCKLFDTPISGASCCFVEPCVKRW